MILSITSNDDPFNHFEPLDLIRRSNQEKSSEKYSWNEEKMIWISLFDRIENKGENEKSI